MLITASSHQLSAILWFVPLLMTVTAGCEESAMQCSILTNHLVQHVLEADKGNNATLTSWCFDDLTSDGDNYSTYVTSVKVAYSQGGAALETTYVAKLNPCGNVSKSGSLTSSMFEKEGQFYTKLEPALSLELTALGHESLRVPTFFYVSLDRGHEVMIMENLQVHGFRMNDRKKGLDVIHATLVIQELARLHAASILLKINKGPELLNEVLSKDWMNFDKTTHDFLKLKYSGHVDNAIVTLEKIGGYDKTVAWLRDLKPRALEILEDQAKDAGPFNVVSHGDCWNNNLLFRYNAEGKPVEVMLLDLQLIRQASLAIDLNFFLYTSLDGHTRRSNITSFLDTYYECFKSVIESAQRDMPFTQEAFKQEFVDKHLYGFLFAIFIIPLSVCRSDQLPKGLTDSFGKKQENLMLDMLDSNPLFRPRFLALFDEMMEDGIITCSIP
ncbi:uncharacterized protein LOC119572204 isoform X1 [Penaeus monodon]|uniref:uncharacterized protein LOC119572204 isoform X1 n=2 Tax=Penaeus monodon TaxID=6687 RepID=UPI0018A6F9F5|nr:uncharacterized protein LOC119572204 isoform X1 [Penaeus monodon]